MNRMIAISSLLLVTCAAVEAQVRFTDVTEAAGIETPDTWKYGGPTLADLNDDGRYDLVLNNHHEVPALLFLSEGEDRFVEAEPVMGGDVHGIAAGDYDRDGRIDLVVSMGGGNGTNPQDIAFVSASRAFVSRYDVSALLVLNPATGDSLGRVDLSTFAQVEVLERVLVVDDGPRRVPDDLYTLYSTSELEGG